MLPERTMTAMLFFGVLHGDIWHLCLTVHVDCAKHTVTSPLMAEWFYMENRGLLKVPEGNELKRVIGPGKRLNRSEGGNDESGGWNKRKSSDKINQRVKSQVYWWAYWLSVKRPGNNGCLPLLSCPYLATVPCPCRYLFQSLLSRIKTIT